jgi:hypothetical protein
MKKLVLFVATVVAVAFAACCNNAENAEEAVVEEEIVVVEEQNDVVTARGSCGNITLSKVTDREAAMIMAIVADQMQTPLNELRFKSIKKIED